MLFLEVKTDSLVEQKSLILALLIIFPIILLGADYFLDDFLVGEGELRESKAFRGLAYLGLALFAFVVIGASIRASGFIELFGLMARNLVTTLASVIGVFAVAKLLLRSRYERLRKRRIEEIELELPQYLEMFHIFLASGMSVLTALKNLGDGKCSSPTRQVIVRVLGGVEEGKSIERALDEAIIPVGSEQLRRFCDAVVIGMERGSSMGQSLRSLIAETRNQSKILLLRRAGKAEIRLLIPVVFLILPISVLFAIWPSYINLVSIMGG